MVLAWLHDLSPWVIRLPGSPIGVRWYGLSYVLGFLAAWWLVRFAASRGWTPVPRWAALDVILWAAAGAMIGGRLFYCIFYQPSLLWTFEAGFPFWGGLMINRGGMASHGGMIGVCVAAWRISRGFRDADGALVGRCPPMHVMELFALVAGPGLLLGRLANFIHGELLGRTVAGPGEPAPAWAVRFPQEHLTGHAPELTPDQQSALFGLIRRYAPNAETFGEGYRRVLATLQEGGVDAEAIRQVLSPLVSARHPSQLYQAAAEGVVATLVVWWLWRTPRRLGLIGGAWLITYGALRIATEFARLPDDHLAAARIAGLSRGQWLSAAMILAGVFVIGLGPKLSPRRFGGWGARADQPADA